MNFTEEHRLARELEDWFWNYGCQRADPYSLPPGRWLFEVTRCARLMERGTTALSSPRPAMAIWGPSQTGKSTLVSAYLDSGASYSGDPSEDGHGSGLHWAGGLRYFFMAPRVDDPEALPHHLTRMVLNPFNKGMDGSACLTRFFPASQKGDSGFAQVTDPEYPVELHLVQQEDLWHALARGYSTECLGSHGRAPKSWDLEGIKRATSETLSHSTPKAHPPQRRAFDDLVRLTTVLEDLAYSDDPVYSELSADREAWQAYLRGLFDEPKLLGSSKLVSRLAERVLWNAAPNITDWASSLAEQHEAWLGPQGIWRGRKLRCSLEAAGLFLNMSASQIAYGPRETNPDSPHGIIQDLIGKLGYTISEDTVRIGCSPNLPHRLGQTADDFSTLQGLVWELAVPIHMDHLPDQPFPEHPERPNALKDFLSVADILDFPGVGNETKSLENRILIDEEQISALQEKATAPDASPQDRERLTRCFTPVLFFREILKRGKTASIVATYGKRLHIDGFSIFQAARGYACPNADQIINGVKTWWRHLTPDYFQNPTTESPFPLNLVITWWAKQLNLAQNPNDSNVYGVIESVVSNLGLIRDASVSTTFAIHDHLSPDRDSAEIKLDFSPGSVRYQNLTSEAAFKQQFARNVSRTSFDSMLTDTLTGGAECFFVEARTQMEALRNRSDGRLPRIEEQMRKATRSLLDTLAWPDLVPQPKVRDTRRERLEGFLSLIRGVADSADPDSLRRLNLFLRELLNIRSADLPGIPESSSVTPAFIERAYDTWVAGQTQRMEGHPQFRMEAQALEIAKADDLRLLLRALVDSLLPDHNDIAVWLKMRLAAAASSAQLTRLFAIRLGNTLVFGPKGPLTSREDAMTRLAEPMPGELGGAAVKDPAYRYFIEPLIGAGGRIETLAARDIKPRKRPDLPGDLEIRKIWESLPSTPTESS